MRRIKKCVKERGYCEGTDNELGHEQSISRRKCMTTCMGLLQLLGFRNLEKNERTLHGGRSVAHRQMNLFGI